MDVSGRRTRPISEDQKGSDEVTDAIQCDQCQDYGRFGAASSFCSNCTDYLCNDCVSQHRMLRVSKDHILLEGTAMPKESPAAMRKEKTRDADGDECPKHHGKLIELYCHSDRTLACVICIAESHRACQNVTSISKLSNGEEQFRELRYVKRTARMQEKLLGSFRKTIGKYRIQNGGCYDTTVELFGAFRSKMECVLDLLGERVHREAGELKERNEKKLDSLSESLKSLEDELASLRADIETKENMKKMDHLFIAVKKMTNHIEESRQQLESIKKELHIQTYAFQADPSIEQILDNMGSTNPLKIVSGDVKCTADIDVKDADDIRGCYVTGLVELSPTDIVVTDYLNTSLKLVDVDKAFIVTRRTLNSNPRDVTVTSASRVAVTLPLLCEIQYFDTKKRDLDPCGRIRVSGKCLAIQSTENTLVVSFNDPAKVEMMDFKGVVKRTFAEDSRGIRLFDWPGYLCLSPDHTVIYVSDEHNPVVTSLSTDGRVIWKYTGIRVAHVMLEDSEKEEYENIEIVKEHENWDKKATDSGDDHENDDEGFSPAGLATGSDGFLYICSHRTHSIHVVSPAGVRLGVIPVTNCGLWHPVALSYSKMHNALYVSTGNADQGVRNFVKRLAFQ